MLFVEIEECDDCPFAPDNVKESGSLFVCDNWNPDTYHPCQWPEKWGNLTCEQVVDSENKRYKAWRDRVDAENERKREKELKKREINDKRERTKLENIGINRDIKRLRKRIRLREERISDMESYVESINFAERVVNHSETVYTNPNIEVLKQLNIEESKQLEELIKERNRRNNERRKQNKGK